MILYPSLMISLAYAGGPAAKFSVIKQLKRSTLSSQYFAVTTFPNPSTQVNFCLSNEGAGRAQLTSCAAPDLNSSRALFTFEPASGSFSGQGRYTMKSVYDGLCVNFADFVQELSLPMTDCAALGTTIPWFFQWNTTNKNPGNSSFANPSYSVISSPYSNFSDSAVLGSNGCYYSNSNGGINVKQCRDTQEMTWFAYMTETKPTDIVVPTADSQPCTLLYNNQRNTGYSCGTIPGGYIIRPPFSNSTGRLSTATNAAERLIRGLGGAGIYNRSLTFSIMPTGTVPRVGDIAELGYSTGRTLYHVGFAPGTTKIQFYNWWYFGSTSNVLTTKNAVPLNRATLVKIVEVFTRDPDSSYYMAKFEIFFDGQSVAVRNLGPKNRPMPLGLYFASPPQYALGTTEPPVPPRAQVGTMKLSFNSIV